MGPETEQDGREPSVVEPLAAPLAGKGLGAGGSTLPWRLLKEPSYWTFSWLVGSPRLGPWPLLL